MPLRMRQPDAANPVTLGFPARQQRIQPPRLCDRCRRPQSQYRVRGEKLCSPCQHAGPAAWDWGIE